MKNSQAENRKTIVLTPQNCVYIRFCQFVLLSDEFLGNRVRIFRRGPLPPLNPCMMMGVRLLQPVARERQANFQLQFSSEVTGFQAQSTKLPSQSNGLPIYHLFKMSLGGTSKLAIECNGRIQAVCQIGREYCRTSPCISSRNICRTLRVELNQGSPLVLDRLVRQLVHDRDD